MITRYSVLQAKLDQARRKLLYGNLLHRVISRFQIAYYRYRMNRLTVGEAQQIF